MYSQLLILYLVHEAQNARVPHIPRSVGGPIAILFDRSKLPHVISLFESGFPERIKFHRPMNSLSPSCIRRRGGKAIIDIDQPRVVANPKLDTNPWGIGLLDRFLLVVEPLEEAP